MLNTTAKREVTIHIFQSLLTILSQYIIILTIMNVRRTKEVFILSIDGGGIRGIIPVMVLQELERALERTRIKSSLCDLFDLFAGTSTGGLISLALAADHSRLSLQFTDPEERTKGKLRSSAIRERREEHSREEGSFQEVREGLRESSLREDEAGTEGLSRLRALLSRLAGRQARDEQGDPGLDLDHILDIYLHQGKRIFPKSTFSQLQSLGQVFSEKYDQSSLEELLEGIFGNMRMDEAVRPVLVTSYDCLSGKPYILSSYADELFYMRDAARATSAAPTYFSPLTISPIGEESTSYCLIDGGVVANNPSLIAYIHAKKLYPEAERYHLLSLGTASKKFTLGKENMVRGGMIGWLDPAKGTPLYAILRSAQGGLSDYVLESFPDLAYYRMETELAARHVRLDDASDQNMRILQQTALELIEKQSQTLERFTRAVANRRR